MDFSLIPCPFRYSVREFKPSVFFCWHSSALVASEVTANTIFAISGTIFTVSLLSMVIFPSELSPTFSTFTVSGTDTVVLHPARETAIIIAKPAAANVLFFILDSSLSLNGMVSHSQTCLPCPQICVFPALTVNHTKTRLLY